VFQKTIIGSGVDPTKLFFLRFFLFGIKLGHFSINNFFLYVTKMQAYQQKTEKFFGSEEKKNLTLISSSSILSKTFLGSYSPAL